MIYMKLSECLAEAAGESLAQREQLLTHQVSQPPQFFLGSHPRPAFLIPLELRSAWVPLLSEELQVEAWLLLSAFLSLECLT